MADIERLIGSIESMAQLALVAGMAYGGLWVYNRFTGQDPLKLFGGSSSSSNTPNVTTPQQQTVPNVPQQIFTGNIADFINGLANFVKNPGSMFSGNMPSTTTSPMDLTIPPSDIGLMTGPNGQTLRSSPNFPGGVINLTSPFSSAPAGSLPAPNTVSPLDNPSGVLYGGGPGTPGWDIIKTGRMWIPAQ